MADDRRNLGLHETLELVRDAAKEHSAVVKKRLDDLFEAMLFGYTTEETPTLRLKN